MFTSIKKYLFNKELNKHKRNATFMSWNDINSILLIFESDIDEINQSVNDFIDEIKSEGKEVNVCCFVNKKKSDKISTETNIVLSKENIDFLEKPKSEFMTDSLKRKYDAVIDLTLNDCLALQYIVLNANTCFRCGLHKDSFKLYDFEIEMNNIPRDPNTGIAINSNYDKLLGEQIVRYLKQVKSI